MLVSRIIASFPVPSLHTPPDAAWFCPVRIELGVHSRVTAAPQCRSLKFQVLWGPKQGRDSRNKRVEGAGKRFAKWSRGEIWGLLDTKTT